MAGSYDVVVLGAGISGLSSARALAKRGFRVAVVERDVPGSHASSAAAGILVSRGVVRSEVPGRMFYTRSLDGYGDWVRALASESGRELSLREGDDFCLFPPGGKADRFRQRLERESDPARWEELDALPDGLSGAARSGPWRVFRFAGERWCVPSDLMGALLAAARREGAVVLPEAGIPRVTDLGTTWKVAFAGGVVESPVLLVSAGPWSGAVLKPLGWDANLVPVRGQLALVPRLHALDAMVHMEDTYYAVPRGDLTLVGATVEHGQWEETVTDRGLRELRQRLSSVFPELDLSRAVKVWAGLRPRTRDRIPHLGWLEPGRLLVASGHYRSGISMAPRTGEVVADLVDGGDVPDDVSALSPVRVSGGYRRIP